MGTMNNLWCFDLNGVANMTESNFNEHIEWKPVKMHGEIPGQVSHHQSVVYGKNMYLIGGTMNGRDYVCSQMSRLDLQTLNWDVIQTRGSGDMPQCIDEHSACADGSKVYVFGGFEDGERVNSVHVFDLELHQWSTCAFSGVAPKPRAGHSAVLYQGSLYIFGGKDDENKKLNDMWKFDISARVWTEIVVDVPDTVPSPRSGHSSTLY